MLLVMKQDPHMQGSAWILKELKDDKPGSRQFAILLSLMLWLQTDGEAEGDNKTVLVRMIDRSLGTWELSHWQKKKNCDQKYSFESFERMRRRLLWGCLQTDPLGTRTAWEEIQKCIFEYRRSEKWRLRLRAGQRQASVSWQRMGCDKVGWGGSQKTLKMKAHSFSLMLQKRASQWKNTKQKSQCF